MYVDDIKLAGKKQNLDLMWNVLNKEVDLGEPTSFLDHVYLGCTQRQCELSKDFVDNYRTMFESRISAGGSEKLPFPQNLRISSWSYDMAGHAKKCVERYCELANKTTQQLNKVSTPCIDDHHFKEEETKSVGELSNTCSQIVLKCLYLARIARPDILWSVNKLARSITKWTKACDKRLNRLISDIHHTSEYKQYCHVENTAKQCRLGLFQDSDFAGDLEDSKSTSGGTLCVFGSHTFVPISWMCMKQTSVSHSSTESEIISLDTGLRLNCLLALELWDLIISVFGNISHISDRTGQLVNVKNKSHNKIDAMQDIDSVPSNVQSASREALLYVFEDSEVVIKMIMKGRSPTMRHVSRTHRVALDWLFDRINLDPKIQIKYIDTKNQLADILTKGNFTRDEWNHLLTLLNISHFSSTACIAAMAKRAQQESGEFLLHTVACREYTLPRDDPASEPKGWIRGNTRIGPTLEITTSFQHFKYGIQVKDNSHSWVRISYGTVRYVNDYIKHDTEKFADPQEEEDVPASSGVVAARSKAKAKPQPRESIGTTTIPLCERKWIDIEPSKQDLESYNLSKKVINLLRHNQKLHREQDGATIQFYKINFHLRDHHSQI